MRPCAASPCAISVTPFRYIIEANLRNPLFVAGTLTFFGILMYLADRFGRGSKDEFGLTWPQAPAIGCAQALALRLRAPRLTRRRVAGSPRCGRRACVRR
jgi:undecaprenyl pyrophosphate phosphatase UppP